MTINFRAQTIEMTKKFASAAKRFGTEAYNQLQEARRDYPTFRVVTKSTHNTKHDNFKGLTYVYMENYIKAHDNGNGATLAEFYDLRGTSDEAKAIGAESKPYHEIKAWFFQQFPAFAQFEKKREMLLNNNAAETLEA